MAYEIMFQNIVCEVLPRKTHTWIQYIVDNKQEELEKHVSKTNINKLYPSEIWKDDVSLLTAAVICGNKDICNYLLREKADPNIVSTKGFTALHYAASTHNVPLHIITQLKDAKANPDGHPTQRWTPIYMAAHMFRQDKFKALMEAGANPEISYGLHPEVDKRFENLFNKLPVENEFLQKCRLFFNFRVMTVKKTQPEVFNFYKDHFLEENPFTHLLLFEQYFNVSGPAQEEYHQSSLKWLKDSKNIDIYIEKFIKRFKTIPNEHRLLALNSLHPVICMIKEIPSQILNALVPILIEQFTGAVQSEIFLLLSILCATIEKSSKQNSATDGSNSDVLKQLCHALKRFTDSTYPINISILTYYVYAAVYECDSDTVNSCGLTSVPERVILNVDASTNDVLKEKLSKLDRNLRSPQRLMTVDTLGAAANNSSSKRKKKKKKKVKKKGNQEDTNLNQNSDTEKKIVEESEVHLSAGHVEDLPFKKNWTSTSIRWKSKLETLASQKACKIYRLGTLTIGISSEFEIAKGSDGTRVFLGLRDDGSEVAVKRMLKSEYQELKNEKHFLRLPELDNSFIVRYVDFTEDSNFGYLVLQLCEYTLEEYIEHHLPKDPLEKVQVLKKLVNNVLQGLKALHNHDTKVLHRDIKPQNVLIDITGKARLADFGISRRLKLGQTTCRTAPAGTKYWKARETLEEDSYSGYKRSSDIQVAGMLIYYILSCGHHPFGSGPRCEVNILDGKSSIEHLNDELAKDLVKCMISHDSKQRPTVEEALQHSFFWADKWKMEYLEKLGNEPQIAKYNIADSDLLSHLEAITEGKSFSNWKTKLPTELVKKVEGKKKSPENMLVLLRFIRNLQVHHKNDAKNLDLLAIFPDLFENAFLLAKQKGWITRMEFLEETTF